MALQSISNFRALSDSFAGIVRASGVNSPLQRINELSATAFDVSLTRPEAIIQGIQAATLKGNAANATLFEALARAALLDEPSITNMLRGQSASTPTAQFAARFNMDTSKQQLFRTYINDINSGNHVSRVQDVETPRYGAAQEG